MPERHPRQYDVQKNDVRFGFSDYRQTLFGAPSIFCDIAGGPQACNHLRSEGLVVLDQEHAHRRHRVRSLEV